MNPEPPNPRRRMTTASNKANLASETIQAQSWISTWTEENLKNSCWKKERFSTMIRHQGPHGVMSSMSFNKGTIKNISKYLKKYYFKMHHERSHIDGWLAFDRCSWLVCSLGPEALNILIVCKWKGARALWPVYSRPTACSWITLECFGGDQRAWKCYCTCMGSLVP